MALHRVGIGTNEAKEHQLQLHHDKEALKSNQVHHDKELRPGSKSAVPYRDGADFSSPYYYSVFHVFGTSVLFFLFATDL